MKLYPLKFQPVFKQRIWGGQKLRELFGKDLPPFEKIGESWELADLPKDKTLIANGELQGKTLAYAIKKYSQHITGKDYFPGAFPLLIKFLDAEDILSVQVHPDEEACERLGEGEPKTECWYIIAAELGSYIYKGLKKGVTKAQFTEAIINGQVADLLQKVLIETGQCHFLPAGTPHAIGPGLLIAEIQLPSDTTYRIFDWNRFDEKGNPRTLHIKQAMESINFDMSEDELGVTTMGRLVNCDFFTIDKGHQTKNCDVLLSSGEMKIQVILSGCGTITSKDVDVVEFKAGDCILIPAAYNGAMCFAAETEYLTIKI
jgi:mannose-6-phosphate isomerase